VRAVENTYIEKIVLFVMVVGSVTKYLLYGLVGAFAISALIDPKRAYGATQAFSGVGSALGSLGSGLQGLLTGVGVGGSKLLNPLWTLKDLIYAPQAGVQTPTDIREIESTSDPTRFNPPGWTHPFAYGSPEHLRYLELENDPRSYPQGGQPIFNFALRKDIDPISPVAPVRVHGQNLPLTQAAIDYYNRLGVTVSPEGNQTVQSQNTQNATSASHAPVLTDRGVSVVNPLVGSVGSTHVATRGGSATASAAAASLAAAGQASWSS
jgi:hypothetical protein